MTPTNQQTNQPTNLQSDLYICSYFTNSNPFQPFKIAENSLNDEIVLDKSQKIWDTQDQKKDEDREII